MMSEGWRKFGRYEQFEDYGQVFVKHGVAMHLWSVYGRNFGRKEFPSWRVEQAEFK